MVATADFGHPAAVQLVNYSLGNRPCAIYLYFVLSQTFSIITPSFRSSSWLKLCIASVADQQAEAEHIVQDAGSDDGTLDWLRQDRRVTVFVEKDQGMYDAINRGMRLASGDILAYLNCDEQYLPGALRRAAAFFEQHPGIDVLFGKNIIVDPYRPYLQHAKVPS